MSTPGPSVREAFLRDRFARSTVAAGRLFDRRLLYAAYLLAGVGTAALCFGASHLIVAIAFILEVIGLAAFFAVDRRRFERALVSYESVLTERGPGPDRERTRDLPRYLLDVDDAIDVPMLDAILKLDGDSEDDFNRALTSVRRNVLAYRVALIWFLPAAILLLIGFVALFVDRERFQVHLAEVTLVGLALIPSVVAIHDINRYSGMFQRLTNSRVLEAERYLVAAGVGKHPFIDGRVVRFRAGEYVIKRRALRVPVDGGSVARQRRVARMVGAEVIIGVGVVISTAMFVVHPISGILVP
jgi:hypothetical protein